MAVPTRQQIHEKILALKEDNPKATKEELIEKVTLWLDNQDIPLTITLFGSKVNTKEQILADLDSYEALC